MAIDILPTKEGTSDFMFCNFKLSITASTKNCIINLQLHTIFFILILPNINVISLTILIASDKAMNVNGLVRYLHERENAVYVVVAHDDQTLDTTEQLLEVHAIVAA